MFLSLHPHSAPGDTWPSSARAYDMLIRGGLRKIEDFGNSRLEVGAKGGVMLQLTWPRTWPCMLENLHLPQV